MTRKIISWLPLWAVFLFTLSSCVHDEVYSASDPDAEQYHSKSPFKEDEKYIKNVISVYEQNENRIKKISGTPLWDYATSMGNLDETFLIVPVADGRKVVACIQVPRSGDMVSFIYDQDNDHIRFFQAFINAKQVRPLKQSVRQDSSSEVSRICQVMAISMWYPDDSYVAGGYWETNVITKCENSGGTDPSDPNPGNPPTYPYPGGAGGGQNPQTPPNPCEKLKAQNQNVNFKNKIDDLKSKLTLKKETGYVEKTNGNFEFKDNASTNPDSNSLSLGNPTSDMKGYSHTHPNNFTYVNEDGYEVQRIGFKIFSPADVIYFNQMVALAQQNGIPLENIYAVMVSGTGIYQIRFTGNINQIKTGYANTKVQYNEMYINYFLKNKNRSDEMNFLKFIDEHMYVKGVSLVKMNNDGTFTTKTLNGDKTEVADSNCPQ